MKKTLILALLVSGLGLAKAQTLKEKEVPSQVKEAFNNHFQGVKVEKWEKEGANYEAEFDLNKIETSAVFDAQGTWLETETEIKTSELPKAVLDYLAKNVPGKKIKEASKISDSLGKIRYEAEIGETDYLFDADGKFLSKEEEKDKD